MRVYVNYDDKRWKKLDIDFTKIAQAVVGNAHNKSEVSIILTNDKEIRKLNKKYRKIDKPTNVLSFELGDDILLGDIYISFDTVKKESEQFGVTMQEHTAHMVVHGVLHLLGYDHIKDEDAVVMENKEIKILKKMGVKNPYVHESGVYRDFECCPGERFLSRLRRFKIRKNSVWQYLILFILGGVASLGFAPYYMWWATILGIAGAYKLVVSLEDDNIWKSLLHVFPFSAAYAMSMFWWVLHSIYVVPELTNQFAVWTIPGLIGIGLLGGVVFAIPFIVISRIRTNPPYRPFLFALSWTVVLWLREWFLTGFPWNPIANITMVSPALSNSMSLWGALGLTFVIVGLIAAMIEVICNRKNRFSWMTLGGFFALLLIGGLFGRENIYKAQENTNVSPIIRIVQPATSAEQKATHSRAEALKNAEQNIKNLISLSNAPEKVDITIFPETAYPFVVLDEDAFPLADVLQTNVISGASYYSKGKMYNSMVVASQNGQINKIYNKSHLVPFGEYRPLGDIIPTPGQLSKGNGPELITMFLNDRQFIFAPAICYEIIFSDSLLPKGNMHIDAIINITNDTWFGNTPGTYQHLDMVRRYAIESGLPVVRSNYSGISAFVASDGSIESLLPVGEAGYIDGMVTGAHKTPYRLIGRDGWMLIIFAFACCAMLVIRKCKGK